MNERKEVEFYITLNYLPMKNHYFLEELMI